MSLVLPTLLSNDKAKTVFTPWKLGLIEKSKYRFSSCTVTFGSYLFLLIVLLKPDFNFSNSLNYLDLITLQLERNVFYQLL